MKKLINTSQAVLILIVCSLLTACADWNSQPVAVDDRFGDAVRHMVKSQTLNPNAGYADQPVLGLDGQKSEGNIGVYRTGNTDLRFGKTPVDFKIDPN